MPTPEEMPPKPADESDALAKALEIELMQKRAAWQRAQARRGSWRALSVLFLVLILLGALLVYFYLRPRLSQRPGDAPQTQTRGGNR